MPALARSNFHVDAGPPPGPVEWIAYDREAPSVRVRCLSQFWYSAREEAQRTLGCPLERVEAIRADEVPAPKRRSRR